MKRKQYLVDKNFQLKKTYAITGFAAAMISLVVVVAGSVLAANNRKLDKNSEVLAANTLAVKSILSLQQRVMADLAAPAAARGNAADLAAAYDNAMKVLAGVIDANEGIMQSNENILSANRILVIVMIGITFAGLVLFFAHLVRQTHRVAGPVHVMSRYMDEILEGEYPEMRDLRTNDDLKGFYERFRLLAARFMELEKKNR